MLPGGKSANAAYWNDWETSPGHFVSSSFYMKKVPRWVKKFNAADRANQYLNQTWTTLYPVETYAASAPDNSQYEPSLGGKPSPTFPYDFKAIREKYKPSRTEYRLLWVSPAGNTILTEFAIAAIENEELGADEVPDMLAVSYSVPDVIGHTFGPQAVEMEDMYLRLDQNLESLFEALDNSVGKDNYTVFLTSDHDAIANIAFLADHKLDANVAKVTANTKALDKFLDTKYGSADWIRSFAGNNIYLNKAVIDDKKLVLPVISQDVADYLMRLPEVYLAITANQLQTQVYTEGIRQTMQNGYHPKRSGDVLVVYNSGTTVQRDEKVAVENVRGTVHGSPYTYDTHVPLLWMGKGIPQGESVRAVNTIDIAPTIAMLLNLQLPSATQSKPLPEILGGSKK